MGAQGSRLCVGLGPGLVGLQAAEHEPALGE